MIRTQIIRFSPGQTAKVLAIIYVVISLIIAPLLVLASRAGPKEDRLPVIFILLFPVLYGIVGYLAVNLIARLYNAVAARYGGIEFETRSTEGTPVQ